MLPNRETKILSMMAAILILSGIGPLMLAPAFAASSDASQPQANNTTNGTETSASNVSSTAAMPGTRIPPSQWTNDYIQSILPERISDKDLISVNNIALENNTVQKIIEGRPFEYVATDYITNDVGQQPVKWLPEIHFNINNETQLTVVVDLTAKSVTKTLTVQSNPLEDRQMDPVQPTMSGNDSTQISASTPKHSFAVDQITGTSSAPKEVEMQSTAMTFTNQISQTVGNVLMLNAQRSSPTSGTACDTAHVTDRYWLQIGFYWKTSGQINYDDTANGCAPVFPALSYTSGHNYKFSITGRTSGGWQATGIDLNTGVGFTYTGPTTVTVDTFRTGDMHTSVFYESKIDDTNYASQYASSPAAKSAKWSPDRTTFSNWPSNTRDDISCTSVHHVYPYGSTTEVISGQLTSAGTATWSMTRMQSNYPGCT